MQGSFTVECGVFVTDKSHVESGVSSEVMCVVFEERKTEVMGMRERESSENEQRRVSTYS